MKVYLSPPNFLMHSINQCTYTNPIASCTDSMCKWNACLLASPYTTVFFNVKWTSLQWFTIMTRKTHLQACFPKIETFRCNHRSKYTKFLGRKFELSFVKLPLCPPDLVKDQRISIGWQIISGATQKLTQIIYLKMKSTSSVSWFMHCGHI